LLLLYSSRRHLRLDFNSATQRWELTCLGRTGVYVTGPSLTHLRAASLSSQPLRGMWMSPGFPALPLASGDTFQVPRTHPLHHPIPSLIFLFPSYHRSRAPITITCTLSNCPLLPLVLALALELPPLLLPLPLPQAKANRFPPFVRALCLSVSLSLFLFTCSTTLCPLTSTHSPSHLQR
jgi:hypothetical protein